MQGHELREGHRAIHQLIDDLPEGRRFEPRVEGRIYARFWDDTIIRDPRQLEWLGMFARIVENAPALVDYEPTVYYRFPALLPPFLGLPTLLRTSMLPERW